MMTEILDLNPQETDRHLADFTDQIMAAAQGDAPPLAENDPELHGLEQTVLRLKQVAQDSRPDPAMAARIRNRATYEWRVAARQSETNPDQPWLVKILKARINRLPPFRSRRTLALGFASLGLVLLVALAIFNPGREGSLNGTAGGQGTWLTLAALALLMGVLLVLIWRNRR